MVWIIIFLDKTQDLAAILHFRDVPFPLCPKGCFYGKVLQMLGLSMEWNAREKTA